jgi:hypothetical protein
LSLKGLAFPPGGQSLIVKGFFNPATPAPAIDPATHGLHVWIEDAAGVIYDVSVPGTGVPPCGERDGWKVGGAPGKTTWKYRNKSGALPPACGLGSAQGLSSLFVKDQSNASKAALLLKLKAKGATLDGLPTSPVTQIQASVALAAQPAPGTASAQAIAGQCAEALITGNPIPDRAPKPFCKVTQRGATIDKISCKGP